MTPPPTEGVCADYRGIRLDRECRRHLKRLDPIHPVCNDAIEVSDEMDAAELQALPAIRNERINIGGASATNLLLSESESYPNSGQY